MFSAVFSPLNSWCVLVQWRDGVNFLSLGPLGFFGGRGWSGFRVWGCGSEVWWRLKSWGISKCIMIWKGRATLCSFLASFPLLGSVFIIEGSGGLNQDALATSQAEFPGIWILHAICQHLADKKTWSNSCALNSRGNKTTTCICPFVTKGGLVPLWFHAHHYDDLGHLVPGLQLRWSAQVLRYQKVKCWRFTQLTKFWSWKNQVVAFFRE